MAMLLCTCGKFKSTQPYHTAATKPWLCDTCKLKSRSVTAVRASSQLRLTAIITKKAHVAKR